MGKAFIAPRTFVKISFACLGMLAIGEARSSALPEDAISPVAQNNVKSLSNELKSISYELTWKYEGADGKTASFAFRFWSKGDRWRAERYDLEKNRNPVYVQCFDGKKYQMLDYATGQLRIVSEIFPKSVAFPSALYDNAPFQLLGFLNYEDPTALPSNFKAASLSDLLSEAKWQAFFKKATPVGEGVGAKINKLNVENASADQASSTHSIISFSEGSNLFPRELIKMRNTLGSRSVEVEVLQFKPTPFPFLEFPTTIAFRWYSPQKENNLVYSAEVTVNSIEFNSEISDDKFSIDINLASEVWDIDNRVVLPTGKE